MAAMRTSIGSGSGSGSSRGSLRVPSAGYKAHGQPHGQSHGRGHDYSSGPTSSPSVSIESLVEHLLAAKRALSSMTAALRANELVTQARAEHEDAAILAAHAGFIRRAISDQLGLLARMRQSFQVTYNSRRRRFTKLTTAMDAAHDRLNGAIDELRGTTVKEAVRPAGEPPKSLLEYMDYAEVDTLVKEMQQALVALHRSQQSFDGDLLRFDNDIRAVQQALAAIPDAPSQKHESAAELLALLVEHAGHMAVLLTALNRHFDRCVTAVRITDGGTAVARRRAAEDHVSGSVGQVSISGYIAEQELHHLDPESPEQRDALMQVVASDATQVNDVISEIHERLVDMEHQSAALHDQIAATRATHAAVLQAHRVLEEVEGRLADYVAAENEFTLRWHTEQEAIHDAIVHMGSLHDFYQSYASAYASLVLEVKRRTAVEQRIEEMWRKTRENVDRLVEEDAKQRDAFRLEAGEYLPNELWRGIRHSVTRWEVVAVEGDDVPSRLPPPPSALAAARDRADSKGKRSALPQGGHGHSKRDSISERPMASPVKAARPDFRSSLGNRSNSGR
jgi:autophagy-related protein 17